MESQMNCGEFMENFLFGEAMNFLHLSGFESRIISPVRTKVKEIQK